MSLLTINALLECVDNIIKYCMRYSSFSDLVPLAPIWNTISPLMQRKTVERLLESFGFHFELVFHGKQDCRKRDLMTATVTD